MAVTANQLIVAQEPEDRVSFPIAGSKHIYQGTMAFLASGYLTDVSGASGANEFAGIAVEEKDNSSGSNGDLRCEVFQYGVFELTGSSFTQGTVGALIYASDNYTITATSTNNQLVGRCVEYVSSTRVRVKIDVLA